MAPKLEGVMGVYAGSSRNGKTHMLKERTRGDARVLVWSVKEQIDNYAANWRKPSIVTTRRGLVRAVEKNLTGPRVIIYCPRDIGDFDLWCRTAFLWGRAGYDAGVHTTAIAEELSDVTSPGKAPQAWGNMLRQGLGFGMNIYGVTQRPVESDKTIMGNLTYCHVHHMTRADDRKMMAKEIDAHPDRILALDKYQWIEKWAGERELRSGGPGIDGPYIEGQAGYQSPPNPPESAEPRS